jgi:hypothetical protein
MDYSDIKQAEVIKVLLEYDEIEEDTWAKVISNEGEYLYVTYLTATSKVYKGACVYEFDSQVSRVEFDSLMEHYPGVKTITDVGWRRVGDGNMWVLEDEVEDSMTTSEVDDLSDYEEEDELLRSMQDFETPDDLRGVELPPDHVEVDKKWDEWQPSSEGARHFKSAVDMIEERVRRQMDDDNF